MARFLIYEDVRETRKYRVEAENYAAAIIAWDEAQDAGACGSFVDAATISFEVQRFDDLGELVETYPTVHVE